MWRDMYTVISGRGLSRIIAPSLLTLEYSRKNTLNMFFQCIASRKGGEWSCDDFTVCDKLRVCVCVRVV